MFFDPDIKRLQQQRNIDGLVKALRHRSLRVRCDAAAALAKLGDSRAVEPLIGALKDEAWEVREQVAVALGELGDGRAVEPLVVALREKHPGAPHALLEAVTDQFLNWKTFGFTKTVDLEAFDLSRAKQWKVHQAAATALGKLKDARAVAPLITVLSSSLWWRRAETRFRRASALITKLDTEDVIAALEDEQEEVRFKVAMILHGPVNTSDVKRLLGQLEMDRVGFSKLDPLAVKTFLDALENHKMLADLVIGLKARPDKSYAVEISVIHALGQLCDPRSVNTLTAVVSEHETSVSAAASNALKSIPSAVVARPAPEESGTLERMDLTCHRCGVGLKRLDMARGAATIGSPLPVLWNGVVCNNCKKLECVTCKAGKPDQPCSWCGGDVSPAFEHLIR